MEIIFPDKTDKRSLASAFKVLLKFGKSIINMFKKGKGKIKKGTWKDVKDVNQKSKVASAALSAAKSAPLTVLKTSVGLGFSALSM